MKIKLEKIAGMYYVRRKENERNTIDAHSKYVCVSNNNRKRPNIKLKEFPFYQKFNHAIGIEKSK